MREHSQTVTECLVGFVKVGTGRAGLTWPAAVDEALCVGWIDAVRRRIDDEHYSIRFTRRKPTSNWSRINVERFTALEAEGRVTDAGRAAFARRQDDRTAIYAYEMEAAQLEEDEARQLRENAAAWTFFAAQPQWYRRNATRWVVNAKRSTTRERRLQTLIADSAAGLWIRSSRPR